MDPRTKRECSISARVSSLLEYLFFLDSNVTAVFRDLITIISKSVCGLLCEVVRINETTGDHDITADVCYVQIPIHHFYPAKGILYLIFDRDTGKCIGFFPIKGPIVDLYLDPTQSHVRSVGERSYDIICQSDEFGMIKKEKIWIPTSDILPTGLLLDAMKEIETEVKREDIIPNLDELYNIFKRKIETSLFLPTSQNSLFTSKPELAVPKSSVQRQEHTPLDEVNCRYYNSPVYIPISMPYISAQSGSEQALRQADFVLGEQIAERTKMINKLDKLIEKGYNMREGNKEKHRLGERFHFDMRLFFGEIELYEQGEGKDGMDKELKRFIGLTHKQISTGFYFSNRPVHVCEDKQLPLRSDSFPHDLILDYMSYVMYVYITRNLGLINSIIKYRIIEQESFLIGREGSKPKRLVPDTKSLARFRCHLLMLNDLMDTYLDCYNDFLDSGFEKDYHTTYWTFVSQAIDVFVYEGLRKMEEDLATTEESFYDIPVVDGDLVQTLNEGRNFIQFHIIAKMVVEKLLMQDDS